MSKYPDVPLITWSDKVVGEAQLSVIRELELPARVARVFMLNDDGEILLQKRSGSVNNPGLIDCSADGWVDTTDLSEEGEVGDYLVAARRETQEELGIEVGEKLQVIGHYLLRGAAEVPEWTKLYIAPYDEKTDGEVKPNDEVQEVTWMCPNDVIELSEQQPEVFEPGARLAIQKLNNFLESQNFKINNYN